MFKVAFLDRLFPLKLREAKVLVFMNLKQCGMSMSDYSLKFTKLSRYAPSLVADPRAYMNKFVLETSNLVKMEYETTILIKEMDIS